jgi:hypothetical protein
LIKAAIALGLAALAAFVIAVIALDLSFWRHPITAQENDDVGDLERIHVPSDLIERAPDDGTVKVTAVDPDDLLAPSRDIQNGALHGLYMDAQHAQGEYRDRLRVRALVAALVGALLAAGAIAAWRRRRRS